MTQPPPSVCFVPEVRSGALAPTTPGLAAEARRLAGALGRDTAAVLLGPEAERLAADVPAGTVFTSPGPPPQEDAAAAAAILESAVRHLRPLALIFTSAPSQAELAARLAARLGTGLAPACLRLEAGRDGTIQATRNVYGGRASCTVSISGQGPQVFTFLSQPQPGRRPAAPPSVVPLPLPSELPRRRAQVVARERVPPMELELEQAQVIVAGGRGAGGPEAFRLMERLATVLGGAVAASRPAVDNGWVPLSRQVGSSGKTVSPRLYIACGISGANQHLVGMRRSEEIVVINTDPHAPLVKLARLALIGDAQAVLAACYRRLEAMDSVRTEEKGPSVPGQTSSSTASAAGPINIGVCISAALDPYLPGSWSGVQPAPGWEDRVLNAADLNAVEEAVRMRETAPAGSRAYGITVGPPPAGRFLRQALALGLDGVYRITGPATACPDSLVTARLLAAAARRLRLSAILCGLANPDGNTGQVPVQMAELLGWELLRGVISVRTESTDALVFCLEDGATRVAYRAPLPAVLAVLPGANRPRYPTLRARRAAEAAHIEEWEAGELGLAASDLTPALRILKTGPPKPAVALAQAAGDASSVEDRLQQLMGGDPSADRKGPKVLQGPPEHLADELVKFLIEGGFVDATAHHL